MKTETETETQARGLVLVDLDPGEEDGRIEHGIDPELRNILYAELAGRAPASDVSVPSPHGPYEYYARQGGGCPYPVFCRRPRSPRGTTHGPRSEAAEEEILLDVNALAGDHPYFVARILAMAPDHGGFVYGVDCSGEERWDLWYRDLGGDEPTDHFLRRDTGPTAALDAEGNTVFFTLLDPARRPWRLASRDVHGGPDSEHILFEETDPAFALRVSKTESGEFLVLTSKSTDTSELHYFPAHRPFAPFRCLHPRSPGVRFAMTHLGRHFYVLTNRDAPNFELFAAKIIDPEPDAWRVVLVQRQGEALERIQAFADHLVVYERCQGRRRLAILDAREHQTRTVPLPEEAGTVFPTDHREYESSELRYGFSSLTRPYSVFRFDLETREQTRLKQSFVGKDFDPGAYASEQLEVPSRDGCRVPISLVYRRDLARPGGNPLLLHGYGAYGYCLEPEFDPSRLSLLDRGVIYAIAHVRGGGAKGPSWHRQGRKLCKRNSIDDFLACAHALVERGYAAPGRLAALGESAGGLLVAAALQREPGLFAAVIADCPFIDVIGALEDDSLPLAVSDWQEWGNPAVPAERAYMESYAPLLHLGRRDYPAVLVLAALADPWAPWQQAAEWALRLRQSTTSGRPILLHIDRDAGHRGPSGRQHFLREVALKYAFLLENLGVAEQPGVERGDPGP